MLLETLLQKGKVWGWEIKMEKCKKGKN